MSRFYVPKEAVSGNRILISGKEAHHILDVMRLNISDEVVVFDGTGKEYVGVVKEAGRKSLSLEIVKVRNLNPSAKYSITLIQAIPKKEKMDYIIEKATELGVDSIIPVTTARTIPDWNDSKRASIVERWRKISLEASKQCGRTDIPEISPIIEFKDAITAAVSYTATVYNLKLIAALNDKAIKFKDALKSCLGGKIAIAIGPEGDFTPGEIKSAQGQGFKTVNLGPRVLKSDTAGLAAISMINYEYQE
ncbi:MAG: 16S rRNA (uracil(1498)-N(3))-methyltransferase [Candidatus Omnitrophota bacterium]|nr:16S rRNA (uracil(1498)-N(3))-methyltransferase [Candidatus Omnitrophota bacterium]